LLKLRKIARIKEIFARDSVKERLTERDAEHGQDREKRRKK
jgi:hypothetical protein